MRVQIPVTVADTRIADLLEAAVCGYWADEFTARFDSGAAEAENYMLDEYADWIGAALTLHSKALVDLQYEMTTGIAGKCSRYVLDRAKIAVGLALLADTAHWVDFMDENEDGTTGDVFLQMCLFGEVVFG